ncbi:hypothetical protein PPYR_05270 [Photinus pyralis]|uniref:Uncharacterized protein n=1 Tax=Photinus pyralis TaxID=7054 RepID=A0A5N4AUC7_PHOPY|nr:protein lifeguard 2-like [Photinus pyralis]KAB0800916.1 hypothetical protein PPYR_05270 [Photinus pyralis]
MNGIGIDVTAHKVITTRNIILFNEDNPNIKEPNESILFLDNVINSAARAKNQSNRYDNRIQEAAGSGQATYYQQHMIGNQPQYAQDLAQNNTESRVFIRNSDQYEYSRTELIFISSFENQRIRGRFIQRVYTILGIQLSCMSGFIFVSTYVQPVKHQLQKHTLYVFLAMCIFLFVYLTLVCSRKARRSFPFNFVLLTIFTIALSYMLAILSLIYKTQIVLMSVGTTVVTTFAMAIMACQHSCDCTRCLPCLCVITSATILFGIILTLIAVTTQTPLVYAIYSAMIGFVFTSYLVFDTQMIMGGRRIQLSPEEYIYAVLTLYTDVVEILMNTLRTFNIFKKTQE